MWTELFKRYTTKIINHLESQAPDTKDEEDTEIVHDERARRAIFTLAQVLKIARVQKERRDREEALKEAGINPLHANSLLDEELDDIDFDMKIVSKF